MIYIILPHNPCWVYIITRKSGKSNSFETVSQISILRCNHQVGQVWTCHEVKTCLAAGVSSYQHHLSNIPQNPSQEATSSSFHMAEMAWLFLSLALISATEVLPSWDLVCFNTASIPSSQNLVKIMSNRDHGPCVTKLAPKSLWPSISHWTHGAHHFLEWTALSECQTHKDKHESNLKHVATALSLVLDLPHLTSTVGSQRLPDAVRLHSWTATSMHALIISSHAFQRSPFWVLEITQWHASFVLGHFLSTKRIILSYRMSRRPAVGWSVSSEDRARKMVRNSPEGNTKQALTQVNLLPVVTLTASSTNLKLPSKKTKEFQSELHPVKMDGDGWRSNIDQHSRSWSLKVF